MYFITLNIIGRYPVSVVDKKFTFSTIFQHNYSYEPYYIHLYKLVRKRCFKSVHNVFYHKCPKGQHKPFLSCHYFLSAISKPKCAQLLILFFT